MASVTAGLFAAGLTMAILSYKYASEKQKRLMAEQPVRNSSRYIYIPSPNGDDIIRIRIPEQMGIFTGMASLFVAQNYGKNKASFDDYVDVIDRDKIPAAEQSVGANKKCYGKENER